MYESVSLQLEYAPSEQKIKIAILSPNWIKRLEISLSEF